MSQTETLMLFVLGFSAALLLVLLLGRGVWSLIGRWSGWKYSRKLPTAMRDLQAERDSLKAEKAMMVRKLDMGVTDMKMRMAEQMAEVSRNRNRVLDLSESLKARLAEIESLKAATSQRQAQIDALNVQISENVKAINDAWARTGERDAELARVVAAHKEVLNTLTQKDERITNLENEARALREIITIFVPGHNMNGSASTAPVNGLNGGRSLMADMVADPFSPGFSPSGSPLRVDDRFAPSANGNGLATLEAFKDRLGDDLMERAASLYHADAALVSTAATATKIMPQPDASPTTREVGRAVSNVLSLAQRFRGLQKDMKK